MKKIIKYRDLRNNNKLNIKLKRIFSNFLNSGKYLPGSKTIEFEKTIANYCGRKYCVGMSSGSNALYLALKSLKIGKGDEIICPAISWIASANAIAMTGAKPVFVDVKLDQTISSDHILEAISNKTKAIMMVHFTGVVADYNNINKIAKSNSLLIIEDAAQAFGAKFNHKYAGNLGDISAFSFNPMKVLPGYGEAGAVLTNSNKVYLELKRKRHLGMDIANTEKCTSVELNSKIDELQASLLLQSLKELKKEIKIRKNIIKNYISELKDFTIYNKYNLNNSSGYDYQIIIKNRDKLKKYLQKKNIETKIKHPILMPNQPIFKKMKRYKLNTAELICNNSLSLPLHSYLTKNDQDYIISAIKKFTGSEIT